MGNYAPCRTGDNDDVHLYSADDPSTALCGRSVGDPAENPSGLPVCVDCGKHLLRRLFRLAGTHGIAGIEITVSPAGGS